MTTATLSQCQKRSAPSVSARPALPGADVLSVLRLHRGANRRVDLAELQARLALGPKVFVSSASSQLILG
eukprot:tig00021251_g19647.t1